MSVTTSDKGPTPAPAPAPGRAPAPTTACADILTDDGMHLTPEGVRLYVG